MKIIALLMFATMNLYAGDLKQEVMDRINYVKTHKDEVWSEQQNILINGQYNN